MIELYEIVGGIDREQGNLLELDTNLRTWGHMFKLKKLIHRTWKRKMFFTARIINKSNVLPNWVVQAKIVPSFKNRCDKLISKNSRGSSFI